MVCAVETKAARVVLVLLRLNLYGKITHRAAMTKALKI